MISFKLLRNSGSSCFIINSTKYLKNQSLVKSKNCLFRKPFHYCVNMQKFEQHFLGKSKPYLYNKFQVINKHLYSTYNQSGVEEIKSIFSTFGLKADSVERVCKLQTQLLKYPIQMWYNIIDVLAKQGIPTGSIEEILISLPTILEVKPNDLNDTINKWRELKLNEEELFKAFTKCPILLILHTDYIDSRIKEIFKMFTNADIYKLLLLSPSVFFDEWNGILEKIKYVQSTMGFTQIQIMRCHVLEHSLLHIKRRHMLALLSGRFKRVTPKRKILTNPSLKFIVDSTVEEFVKECGLTVEEYNVFCNLVKLDESEETLSDDELDSIE